MESETGNVIIQWTMYGSLTEPLFLFGISLVGLYLFVRRRHWKYLLVFIAPLWILFFHFVYPISIAYSEGLDRDGEGWQTIKNDFLITVPSVGTFLLLLYFIVDGLNIGSKSNKPVQPTSLRSAADR